MLTLSIIKADTGGFVGHSGMHPEMLRTAREAVVRATHGGRLHARLPPRPADARHAARRATPAASTARRASSASATRSPTAG